MQRSKGFSLLELLIALVIVAALAAIAVPQYRQYVLRSHRVDAAAALQDLAARQERYHFSHRRYAATLDALGAAKAASGDYYVLDIAGASSAAYQLRATAIGSQMRDEACATMSLDRTGLQQSTGTTDNDAACWGR